MKKAHLEQRDGRLILANGQVELAIDARTGYFHDLHNRATGLHHLAPMAGCWPVGLELGKPGWPDFLHVQIHPDKYGASPQQIKHRLVQGSHDLTLEMTYGDLLTTGGASTGVTLTVSITLGETDYFLIRARVVNRGTYEITKLYSGSGDLLAAQRREDEKLAVPTWHFGTIWENPAAFFKDRETFGLPIFGTFCGLDAAWFDLYGPVGGVGVGYLNRQGMTMLFNVQRGGQGTCINWQHFNIFHQKAQDHWGVVGCVCGLKPGEEFTTDPWILAAHQGDWHRMAEIYRAEYNKEFQGDYLTWDRLRPSAKKLDLYLLMALENKQFRDVPPMVKRYLDDLGAAGDSMAMLLWGTGEKFPRYMPDHLPCRADRGGDAGCKKMTDDLHALGMDAVLYYAHLYYNHPKARDYVAAADTGFDHSNAMWPEIGNIACVEHEAWQRLWLDKYIPGYAALGAGGVVLDQGPTQCLVCPRDDHRHGTAAVSRLSSHIRGVDRLIRGIREGLGTRQGLIGTEVGGDVQTRMADLWECPPGDFYSPGGRTTREIVRYTAPYKLGVMHLGEKPSQIKPRDMNEALLLGMIASLFVQGGPEPVYKEMTPETLAALKQFVRIRREIRQAGAPGYPQGFMDQKGLKVGDTALSAKVYRGENGATVVYYASKPVKTVLTVDRAALDLGDGVETLEIMLEKDQAGFKVVAQQRTM